MASRVRGAPHVLKLVPLPKHSRDLVFALLTWSLPAIGRFSLLVSTQLKLLTTDMSDHVRLQSTRLLAT